MMQRIPVNDLKRGFALYQTEFEAKAIDVLRSGWYVMGNEMKTFEAEFAAKVGTEYCVGVDNGLDAILLGIKALNIGDGDEVIVASNTYIATALGASLAGATPVFVEPTKCYNIDPDKIEAAITSKTKAVLVTHLYGQACEMGKISTLCKKHALFLLEDCAQAHFATYGGKQVGTFGEMGFFSFYPTKNLGAFGDGGAVTTNDAELCKKIQMLRNYGSIVHYQNDVEGYNARLDEIQAGLLRVRLAHAEEIMQGRRKIAERYLAEIHNPAVSLPQIADGCTAVWHLFVVEVAERAKFRAWMDSKAIGTDVHYPIPPHLSGAYAHLGHHEGDFPIAEHMAKHVVSLPIFTGMTEDEVKRVIEAVNEYEA